MKKKTCQHCGTEFTTSNPLRKYCSIKCSAEVQSTRFKGSGSAVYKGGPPVFVCTYCGQSFGRYATTNTPKYCSRGCMTLDYRDRFADCKNPAWRGGAWPYKGKGWRHIAARVVERDKTCRDCGSTGPLSAHHLVPQRFWLSIVSSNVESNLIALCQRCHVLRPEHFWLVVPDSLFDPTLHSKQPMPRTTVRIIQKKLCRFCGNPVKSNSNDFCSVACANRDRWRRGIHKHQWDTRRENTIIKNTKRCAHCGTTFVRTYGFFCCRKCFLSAPPETPEKKGKRSNNA